MQQHSVAIHSARSASGNSHAAGPPIGHNAHMARRGRPSIVEEVAGGQAELLPDPDYQDAWLLVVDGAQQSHVNLADPTALEFEYVRRMSHVIDTMPAGPLRAAHLGGGGMTLARYVSATRPHSSNLVVELDEPLTRVVRTHLPWPGDYRIKIRICDARAALDTLPPASIDVLICDVFAEARTPAGLTSTEAFAAAARALRPEGRFLANIADQSPLDYARRFTAGVAATWPHVAMMVDPAVLRGRRFGNFVLAAGQTPLPEEELIRRCAGDPWPARFVSGRALAAFLAKAQPYTDATATGSPVPPPGVFAPF